MSVLNIFTDASLRRNPDGTTDTCAGFCYNDVGHYPVCSSDKKGLVILKNTTNNQGEAMAMLMGLNFAFNNKDKFDTINIFSDSQWCVYSLTKWIYTWVKTESNGIWYNSSGEEVKNLDIFYNIINIVLAMNRKINLYHVIGHSGTSDKDLDKFYNKFIEFNNLYQIANQINKHDLMVILIGNSNIDAYTRQALTSSFTEEIVPIIDGSSLAVPIQPNFIHPKLVYKFIRLIKPDPMNINI